MDMMSQEQFLRIIRTFGPTASSSAPTALGQPEAGVEQLRALPLSQEEKDAILGGTAQKLLSLPQRH